MVEAFYSDILQKDEEHTNAGNDDFDFTKAEVRLFALVLTIFNEFSSLSKMLALIAQSK